VCDPATIATGVAPTVSAISVGVTDVYWSIESSTTGGLSFTARATPSTPDNLTTANVASVAVDVTTGDLYYTTLSTPTVSTPIGLFRIAKTDASTGVAVQYATSAPATSAGAVVVGGLSPRVFFAAVVAGEWNIYQVDPSGSMAAATSFDSWPVAGSPLPPLFHDGRQPYWFDGDTIKTVIPGASGSSRVVTPKVASMHQLAVDPSSSPNGNLYWTEGNSLYAVPKAGSTMALTMATAIATPAGVVADGNYVYWLDAPASCTSPSTLSRASNGSTGVVVQRVATTPAGCAANLAQDDTYLYYSFFTHGVGLGWIYRVPK